MSGIGYRRNQARIADERRAKQEREKAMGMFEAPSSPSGGLDFKDHEGALLLVEVISVEDHVPTVHTKPGEKSPAVRADVHVIDGTGAPADYADALVFPKILQSQLNRNVGKKVLGRLGRGTAKPGQSAPWILSEADDADQKLGEAWVQQHAQSTVVKAEVPF